MLNPAQSQNCHHRAQKKAQSGFSLIEMLTVIAIAGIFMAIAIPAYQNIISANRITAEVNDLYRDLEFARSEAAKRGQNIVVCPSSDGNTCTGGTTWKNGWIVLLGGNNLCSDTSKGTTGAVLRIKQAFSGQDTAGWTAIGTNNVACFNRLGFVPSSNLGYITLNTTPASNSNKRCLAVSAVGHIQILSNGQQDVTGGVTC